MEFTVRKMDWLKDYSIEKVVETVVRWQERKEVKPFFFFTSVNISGEKPSAMSSCDPSADCQKEN